MVIEKLKDKINNIYNFIKNKFKRIDFKSLDVLFCKKNLLMFLIFLFFTFISIKFKNLSIFFILNIMLIFAYNIKDINVNNYFKYKNIISYLYIVSPVFSYVYILNIKNNSDLFLWIFLSIFFLKTTYYLYKNNLDGVLFDNSKPKNLIFAHINLILLSIFIGIISSILLKQKIILFIIINVILAIFVVIQDNVNTLINNYFENKINTKKHLDIIIEFYNNFILIFPFVAFLIATNIIIIK